jgi:hypothetical protein
MSLDVQAQDHQTKALFVLPVKIWVPWSSGPQDSQVLSSIGLESGQPLGWHCCWCRGSGRWARPPAE